MEKKVYDVLKMRYSSKPELVYYFDPDLDIQTKVGTDSNGWACVRIGFFEEGKVKLISN